MNHRTSNDHNALRGLYEAALAEEARLAEVRIQALRDYEDAVAAREAAYDACYPESGYYAQLDLIPVDEELDDSWTPYQHDRAELDKDIMEELEHQGLHLTRVEWPTDITTFELK